jgi:hypothetical protein
LKVDYLKNLRTFDRSQLDWIYKNSEGALAYIDVADEGSDYLAMAVGHLIGNEVFITDVIYTKATPTLLFHVVLNYLKM